MQCHDPAAVCRLRAMNNLNLIVVVLQVFFDTCAYFHSEFYLRVNNKNIDYYQHGTKRYEKNLKSCFCFTWTTMINLLLFSLL